MLDTSKIIEKYGRRIIDEVNISMCVCDACGHFYNNPFYCSEQIFQSKSFKDMEVFFSKEICKKIIQYLKDNLDAFYIKDQAGKDLKDFKGYQNGQ